MFEKLSVPAHFTTALLNTASIRAFDMSEQKGKTMLVVLHIKMPKDLLVIMMCIGLYFLAKICLAVTKSIEQRVFKVHAPGTIDAVREREIQREVEITHLMRTQSQTINRIADNRVRPEPQENQE